MKKQTVPGVECEIPFRETGRVSVAEERDNYVFQLVKGERIRIEVTSRRLGFHLDPLVRVVDSSGKQLAENDDAVERDSRLDFTSPSDGAYTIVVSDLHQRGGDDFVYGIVVERVTAAFNLKVGSENFVVTQGQELSIPIDVIRSDGFNEMISIAAIGLPSDVVIASSTSQLKKESEKKVELKVSVNEPYSGPFRIVGLTGSSSTYTIAVTDSVVGGEDVADLWLTVKPKE